MNPETTPVRADGHNALVEPDNRIIAAQDCDRHPTAADIVDQLRDECRFHKIGLELLTAACPGFVKHHVAQGKVRAAGPWMAPRRPCTARVVRGS